MKSLIGKVILRCCVSAVLKGLCLSDIIYIKDEVIRYLFSAGIHLVYAA